MNLSPLLPSILVALHLALLYFSPPLLAVPTMLEAVVVTQDGKRHTVSARIRSRQKEAEVPVNDVSAVPVRYYEAEFVVNGKSYRTALTPRTLRDLNGVETFFRKNGEENWDVNRSDGGLSSGTFKAPGLVIKESLPGLFLPTGVTARMNFFDFAGSQSRELERDAAGNFISRGFTKPFEMERDSQGNVKFPGIPGKTDYKATHTQDLRAQRFIVDFGDHPDRVDKKLIYPVYVQDFNGRNALIVPPSELTKLEKARAGEEVTVQLYSVPAEVLRRVPPGADGDALLQGKRVAFVDDSDAGIKPVFRANPIDHHYQFKVKAGRDLSQSIASLNLSVSGCSALSDI